tara:strand:- start:975 stop:2123 length:1149 start_codon:yes stop_codon:yes gene_type:complete
MLSSPILLDYQSSTPCTKEVVEAMQPYWTKIFANPSSKSNLLGIQASAALEFARESIKNKLNIHNKKIIFTSGATESNNLALLGFARSAYNKTRTFGHIITLQTEHHAVLEPLKQLRKKGFSITEISPEEDGIVSLEKIKGAIQNDTILMSIMLANNEIGVIQPLEEISKICKEKEIILHTDAAQCLGYIPCYDFDALANMITISSHKIYGPKGIGLLLVDNDISIEPMIVGGGQEFGIRSGTIPLPLIFGFDKAIELALLNQDKNQKKLSFYRDNLLKGLLANNSEIFINGSMSQRLPHNLNITFSGVSGSLLHKSLKPKIVCSSGSACSNGRPSHVLMAIGRSLSEAESSIRLSIGLMTTSQDIEKVISIINSIVSSIKK